MRSDLLEALAGVLFKSYIKDKSFSNEEIGMGIQLGDLSRMRPGFDRRDAKVTLWNVDPVDMNIDPATLHTRRAVGIEETPGAALHDRRVREPDRKGAGLDGMVEGRPAHSGGWQSRGPDLRVVRQPWS